MKILLVGDFSLGSLGLSYLNSFKKLEANVTTFDHKQEYKNRFLYYFFERCFNKALNKKFYELIRLNNFDFVFILKGAFIFPWTLQQIKKTTNTMLFNFNPDNPFNLNRGASNDLIRRSIPFYDCYFIWGKFLMPELIKAGAKRVEYLPFAYDPDLHYSRNLSVQDKAIYGSDIAFIGSWDKEREWWLEKIEKYDLAIWGNGWKKLAMKSPLRKKWKEKEVIGEDFSKVCSASKIILNLVRKQNANAHNMRTFEVPACKGFMLTTRTKEQCEFFEEGEDIACFETQEELKDKIKQSLNDSEARQNMSESAYKKIQGHSYDVRVKEILDIYSKMK